MESMDRCHQKRPKITITDQSEEVISNEWKFINITEQEEDLIYRMYRLVGPRWDLIAGRIPGRKAEVLERFWIMRHCDAFAEKRIQHKIEGSNIDRRQMFNGFK
ncbi:MYB-like transcription factor TCL1 [Pyrus x bretschneideri]|uniref:MYB-like transcription factor TCL1 n=1 Tax=Pyrus x bretschneideri TaxID=225117 RepID=UPI000510AB0C|nr:MYB-like transcription factor TCL1 [Pyrus x bretschneideri]